MEKLLPFVPLILGSFGLLFSGAFLKFVIDLVKISGQNRATKLRHDRLYEVAFRRADADARNIAQFVIAVCSAHKAIPPKSEVVGPYLDILCNALGTVDEDGAWHANPFPNHLRAASIELKLADVEARPEELEKPEEK